MDTKTDRGESAALPKFRRCNALAKGLHAELQSLRLIDCADAEQLGAMLCQELDDLFGLLSEGEGEA